MILFLIDICLVRSLFHWLCYSCKGTWMNELATDLFSFIVFSLTSECLYVICLKREENVFMIDKNCWITRSQSSVYFFSTVHQPLCYWPREVMSSYVVARVKVHSPRKDWIWDLNTVKYFSEKKTCFNLFIQFSIRWQVYVL